MKKTKIKKCIIIYFRDNLSLTPINPPPSDSILYSVLKPKQSKSIIQKTSLDKPVVFHRKVNSSGYTASPWMPKQNKSTKTKKSKSASEKSYPINCGLLNQFQV